MFILAIFVSREGYFRKNGRTRSKVEKREQGFQLGNPRITHLVKHFHQKIIFAQFARTKNSWPAKELRIGS